MRGLGIFMCGMTGLMKKYKFIILPPNGFHFTMNDRLSDARHFVADAVDVVNSFRQPGESLVIKYRSHNETKNYPTEQSVLVGYGQLLDLCSEESVVIGNPGSATWECLLNGISFYSIWNINRCKASGYFSQQAITGLSNMLYIANNKNELLDNLKQRKIYKPGKSLSDLSVSKTLRLTEIIDMILTGHRNEQKIS